LRAKSSTQVQGLSKVFRSKILTSKRKEIVMKKWYVAFELDEKTGVVFLARKNDGSLASFKTKKEAKHAVEKDNLVWQNIFNINYVMFEE
jgi:hypothetical protein